MQRISLKDVFYCEVIDHCIFFHTSFGDVKVYMKMKNAERLLLTPTDVYSLFGNAIDNAIEALLKVESEEKRIIQMSIRAKGKIIYVNIDNYSEKNIEFKNGMPVTTKSDDKYHGFGLKSIRYITEKYGGAFSVSQKKTLLCYTFCSLPQTNDMNSFIYIKKQPLLRAKVKL